MNDFVARTNNYLGHQIVVTKGTCRSPFAGNPHVRLFDASTGIPSDEVQQMIGSAGLEYKLIYEISETIQGEEVKRWVLDPPEGSKAQFRAVVAYEASIEDELDELVSQYDLWRRGEIYNVSIFARGSERVYLEKGIYGMRNAFLQARRHLAAEIQGAAV